MNQDDQHQASCSRQSDEVKNSNATDTSKPNERAEEAGGHRLDSLINTMVDQKPNQSIHDKNENVQAQRAEEMSLAQLNDDCLITIFRMLSLNDLNAITDTCSRFRDIATSVFALQHRTIDLNAMFLENKCREICEFRKVLIKFDGMISLKTKLKYSVLESNIEEQMPVLNLISEHCGESLKYLNVFWVNINALMVPSMRLLFGNLETLLLDFCSLEESIDADFFPELNRLSTLRIWNCHGIVLDNLFKFRYPKLISLSLLDLEPLIIDEDLLRIFFQNHNRIQELEISLRAFAHSHNALRVLCTDHLKTLNISEGSINDLAAIKNWFKNVQTLTFKYVSIDIPDKSLFSECKNVVSLDLFSYNTMEGVLSSMTRDDFHNLEYLKLNAFDIIYVAGCQEFLMNKKKLKSIFVDSEYVDAEDYESVIECVAHHLNKVEEITFRYLNIWGSDFLKNKSLAKLRNITKMKLQRITSITELKLVFLDGIVDGSINSLTHLEIITSRIDNDVIATITNCKNLRNLQLSDINDNYRSVYVNLEPLGKLRRLSVLKLEGHMCISVYDLIELVTTADKLASLTLNVRSFKLGSEDYEKMTEIVHKRKQTLVISIGDGVLKQQTEFNELYIKRDVSGL